MLYTIYAWSVFLHLLLTILAVHSVREQLCADTQHGLCRGKVVTIESSAPCMARPTRVLSSSCALRKAGLDEIRHATKIVARLSLREGAFRRGLVFHLLLCLSHFWHTWCRTCRSFVAGLKAKERLFQGVLVWKPACQGLWAELGKCPTACKTAQTLCHCGQWFSSKILRNSF